MERSKTIEGLASITTLALFHQYKLLYVNDITHSIPNQVLPEVVRTLHLALFWEH